MASRMALFVRTEIVENDDVPGPESWDQVGPSLALEDDDLPVGVWRDVRPRFRRQLGECLPDFQHFAPDAGNGNLAALRKALPGKKSVGECCEDANIE
ncbi:hypothetical protein FHX03_003266 [Rhizobium sp. BK456]|nr:hypothetical protein [Rhizobium sp. BK456]